MMNSLRAATPHMPRTIEVADRVVARAVMDSTNVFARYMIDEGQIYPRVDGKVPITVVAADLQTEGHGRLGRTWVNMPGESFTVSFATVLPRYLATDPNINGWLQMCAGLSAINAIREVCDNDVVASAKPECVFSLKWPNDIFCHDLKLGGILCELVTLPHPEEADPYSAYQGAAYRDDPNHDEIRQDMLETNEDLDTYVGVVFGIGINLAVRAERLPTPLSTSLQMHRDGLPTAQVLRDMIAAALVVQLRSRLQSCIDDTDHAMSTLLKETRTECWTLGRRVEAHLAQGTVVVGTAISLNPDASLNIRDDDGNIHVVHTGDVGVLPPDSEY
jgi:BirA family biotin operon repressor/biotin-[acetyl-CoA-carboxylase] ligase